MMATELVHVVNFLNTEFPKGIQMFNSRNVVGDTMKTIAIFSVNNRHIIIDYCEDYEYIEIFGLTESEFQMIKLIVNYHIKMVDVH